MRPPYPMDYELVCRQCQLPYRTRVYQTNKKRTPPSPEVCQRCTNHGWLAGEDVGAGWQPLLVEMNERLSELDPDYQIGQIKEKWGGLRYYFTPSPWTDEPTQQKMWAIEHEIEARSYQICEECGEPGSVDQRYPWIRTLCPAHQTARESKRPWAIQAT
jgi:hypothetical protein